MINSFRVQNFKSLRDVSITFSPLTVMIGRSGVGKSSIVQAIRMLREALRSGEKGFAYRAECLPATDRPSIEQVSYQFSFDAPGHNGQFYYGARFQPQGKTGTISLASESLYQNQIPIFEQTQGDWQSIPPFEPRPLGGQLALFTLNSIDSVRVPYLTLSKGIGCFDFGGDVLISDTVGGIEYGLLDSGANGVAAFDAIANNLSTLSFVREMVKALCRLNKSIVDVAIRNKKEILVTHQATPTGKLITLPLWVESEGLRRFLAHLIAIYQQPPMPVLIFEEPEKGIFPGALAVLVDYFRLAISRGAQVIVTTHSPELLKHVHVDEIRVVTMPEFETIVGPVSTEQREAINEHLLTTDELLNVDEARIDPAAPTQA